MTDRELMQQVLHALECATPPTFSAKLVEDWEKAIEALRARLAQPEPEQLGEIVPADEEQLKRIAKLVEPKPVAYKVDGATVYIKPPIYTAPPQLDESKFVAKMREMLEVQGRDGTWNYSPYFRGMYNGMEFMLALVEDREPVYRDEPEKYLAAPPQRKEWQELSDYDVDNIVKVASGKESAVYLTEAKLKEKNAA